MTPSMIAKGVTIRAGGGTPSFCMGNEGCPCALSAGDPGPAIPQKKGLSYMPIRALYGLRLAPGEGVRMNYVQIWGNYVQGSLLRVKSSRFRPFRRFYAEL